jgi:hypothetical protein
MKKLIYILTGVLIGLGISVIIEFDGYQTGLEHGRIDTQNKIFSAIIFPG